ncbi:MAG: Lrp/AsnC family transcriptional regulator [Haloferacaceae archaeon]
MELDEIDREILRILQQDARTPFSEIARQIDMSSATVHERVGRMEDAGVIEGYHAKVDPAEVGFATEAFVGVRVEQGYEEEIVPRLRELEPVREIHLIAGKLDMILRVQAQSRDELRELVFDRLGKIDGFARTNTMVILGTEYDEEGLPI